MLVFQMTVACCLSVGGSEEVPGMWVSWDGLKQIKMVNYPNYMKEWQ